MPTDVTRYIVLLPVGASVRAGVCPACDGIIDDTGCRLEDRRGVRPAAPERTGWAAVVEVWCRGEPALPVSDCPACAAEAEGV